MSSGWSNDSSSIQNHNGNGFSNLHDLPPMMDPSTFMGNPAQYNTQYPSAQQLMAAQNGNMRNPSPSSFQNPMYQTNPVIPSKRPRPREDGMGQSPRQAPGMIAPQRSETPHQSPFPGYQQTMASQSSGQPSPYPHLQQNGSANATPSPIMANQMRPGSVPQRVSTTSPHPFSPASQQFPQPSPVSPEHGGTPQPNAYMQQSNYPQGYNGQYAQSQTSGRPSPTPSQMGGHMMAQQMSQVPQQLQSMSTSMAGQLQGQMPSHLAGQMNNQMYAQQAPQGRTAMDQQRMMYQQMNLQQQVQRNNMQMQPMSGQNMMQGQGQSQAQVQAKAQAQAQVQAHAQAQAQARNMMAGRSNGQMSAGQIPPGATRPQQSMAPQQAITRQQYDHFMKNLTMFMTSKQLPLDGNPSIEGRPVNLMMLFQAVYQKYGGYRNVCQANNWHQIAATFGFSPNQFPTAPQHIKNIYERNLFRFEEVYVTQQQKAKMQQQQQAMPNNMANVQHQQHGTPTKPYAPSHAQPSQMTQPSQQAQISQGPSPTPMQQPTTTSSAGMNGFSASTAPSHGSQPPYATPVQSRSSAPRSVQQTPTAEEFPPSPVQSKRGSVSAPVADPQPQVVRKSKFGPQGPEPLDPDEYIPGSREITTYGGVDLTSARHLGDDLDRWRPDVPPANELGLIDIHALSKSIQSGIHAEIRMALDTLASVTNTPSPNLFIDLRMCEDLVDTLIECAEDQVEFLAENTEEASDEICITPYEDVVRAIRLEKLALHKLTLFGSTDYHLDRAVDRLICITTILRNLSFAEENQLVLAEDTVVKFLCVVIRYLGTRDHLLRTHSSTLDFMKDIVVFLSNVSTFVEIPEREQALCLLQFLLAFAPAPGPTTHEDKLFFPPYEPALHPYLPHAVDGVAKLLARYDTNRAHFKALFDAEAALPSTPPCEMLTRTFALGISPVPDQNKEARSPNLPSVVEARKPFLMQGLLAAEVLSSMAPASDSGLARAWLTSGNGFAQKLFFLIRQLSQQFENQVRPGAPQPRGQVRRDSDLVYMVRLAVSMLRRLSERARDAAEADGEADLPPNVLPSTDSVLGALQMASLEWTQEGMLADLVAYASLDD